MPFNAVTKRCFWSWLLFFVVVMVISCDNKEIVPPVLTDNVGYNIGETKMAVVTDVNATDFSIRDLLTKEEKYRGIVDGLAELDLSSGDYVRTIDFTDFTDPGVYYITLNDSSKMSHIFRIGSKVYEPIAYTSLRSFYLQRCGTAIESEKWGRVVCHTDKAAFFKRPEKKLDVNGGWHDAGDYNKFSVTHNVTLAYLLKQYTDDPAGYWDGQLDISESGNDIPDILDEIRWGLEWLMKVQASEGGVYHKVSIKEWAGENLPHEENEERFIFSVSSAGTAGAVGAFAYASRVFEQFDPEFAAQLKEAALKSWKFLEENPMTVPAGGFVNPNGVYGGEYGDTIDKDERIWAAIQLYKLTREPGFLEYFHLNYKDFWNESFYVATWQDLRNFAYYAYLELGRSDSAADPVIYNDLEVKLVEYLNSKLDNIDENGYNYVLKKEEFYWGSNSVAMGYAFDFIQGYRLTGNEIYRQAALDQMHYILGRNPLGKSFVTGAGSNPVRDPYHQFSKLHSPGDPLPGMLVGGANYYSHLNGKIISAYTAKNYEDRFRNYMVNEPAINYTAAFSYVAGYFKNSEGQLKGTQ